MYKMLKTLLLSAALVSSLTVGSYAAGGNEGMHEHNVQQSIQVPSGPISNSNSANSKVDSGMSGHEGMNHSGTMQHEQNNIANPENGGSHSGHSMSEAEMAAMETEGGHGGHGGHGDTKSSASQGPDWPVIYGFGAVNFAVITAAALKRYVFKARTEVK